MIKHLLQDKALLSLGKACVTAFWPVSRPLCVAWREINDPRRESHPLPALQRILVLSSVGSQERTLNSSTNLCSAARLLRR